VQAVKRFFLRATHWQIFLLVWGTYFIGTLILVSSVPEGRVENPLRVGLFSEAILSPFVLCSMGWLWAIGAFLFSIAEPSLRLNIHFFRFAIIFPTVCLLTALPFFLSSNRTIEAVILPLHLLALACLLYVFYFNSKSLRIVEKREMVTTNDYLVLLFLFFFSLVGIWLIQPKINQLYRQENT
jgi:hypothetical protein